MDGENAWEYYPQNGWAFLQGLYTRLAEHPRLRLTTFSDVLGRSRPRELPELCAGSWVHGNLSTWIGDSAKNRAWELLAAAKRAVDGAFQSEQDDKGPKWVYAVLRQLAVCEASDWFWWLAEGEGLQDAPEFCALFRRNLTTLYALLEIDPPSELAQPLTEPAGGELPAASEVTGAMRRSG